MSFIIEDIEYLFVFINDGWWLKLSNLDELLNYHEVTGSRWGDAFLDYTTSKLSGKKPENKLAQMIDLRADGKHTALDLLEGIKVEIITNQLKTIHKNGYIHVNRAGGCCSVFDESDEKQWVRRKKLVFPNFKESDIRIKKWGDNGIHFYAYIDDMQVYDGDKMKWETYSEAYEFSKQFIYND